MGSRARLAVAVLGAVVLAAALSPVPQHAQACAFLRRPYAYEAEQTRETYLTAVDAASLNQLFPGDAYFGLPPVERGVRGQRTNGAARLPATLLKAIAWVESTLTMASRSVAFESGGPALVSFDCGHGVMQVTSGMTVPLGGSNRPTDSQVNVATHYVYNIARGAAILADKWNRAPAERPIAGTDTGADPSLVENWYFATWSYNGFTGPGSNSSNHPLDPAFGGWPRSAYRCDGTQSRSRYPYQELVWGCMAQPPSRDNALLWTPLPASLPNLSQPRWFEPLSLSRFRFPYAGMDIPTPQPAHVDAVPQLPSGFRERLLGRGVLRVDVQAVAIRLNGLPQDARVTIEIQNVGSGILSWSIVGSANWIVADPPAGVALGADVPCTAPCERAGAVTISVNPTLLPQANTSGTLIIRSPNSNTERTLRIRVEADFEVGAPGTSRAY